MSNPFSNLNWADVGKGLLILVVSTILASLVPVLQSGWPTWSQFEPILQTTTAAALVYLVKNIFTNNALLVKSSFGTINLMDIIWGFIIAVASTMLSSLADILMNGWPTWTTFQPILLSAVLAGITYIMKSVVTNSNNVLLQKEQK
jgi:hypothetical protein